MTVINTGAGAKNKEEDWYEEEQRDQEGEIWHRRGRETEAAKEAACSGCCWKGRRC